MADLRTVGIRELRSHATEYLGGTEPVAVTRHGKVIGFYLPVPPDEEETRRAWERLERTVAEVRSRTGLSEEQLSDLFDLRKPLPE